MAEPLAGAELGRCAPLGVRATAVWPHIRAPVPQHTVVLSPWTGANPRRPARQEIDRGGRDRFAKIGAEDVLRR